MPTSLSVKTLKLDQYLEEPQFLLDIKEAFILIFYIDGNIMAQDFLSLQKMANDIRAILVTVVALS